MKCVSLFAGAGGLDTGFQEAGFEIIWANEYDAEIHETYQHNHPNTVLNTLDINKVKLEDIPECDGLIGGPPCQSWSCGGAQKGEHDKRGKLFFRFIEILEAKKPKFFLAENVKGILSEKHKDSLKKLLELFDNVGYDVVYKCVNANDYDVPQDRYRVIFIGIRKELKISFEFPKEKKTKPNLKDVIYDLKDNAVPGLTKNYHNPDITVINHEYAIGGFSSRFMSRNRVRSWEESSFTIPAMARQVPLHPGAPKMEKVDKDKFEFDQEKIHTYRRLTVRECARIQTFPDTFEFKYKNVIAGYKMIGNAVPVELGKAIASQIKTYF